MKYQRFEDLPVWNDAIDLAVRVLGLSQSGQVSGVGDVKSQLSRAAISISNNIAEGFERGTNDELVSFLCIAKGSAGEVRSILHLLMRMPNMDDLAPQVAEIRARAENVSKQLGRWIESIKDSGYRGKRSQNTQTRQAAEAARRGDQFLRQIREIQDQAIWGSKNRGDGPIDPAQPSETEEPPR